MAPLAQSDQYNSTRLDPGELLAACPQLLEAKKIYVGFSGGLDSTVLLYLLAGLCKHKQLSAPLTALHVNHGLQTTAQSWELHCSTICERLNVPILRKQITVDLLGKESPEEAARTARYAAFANVLEEGDILLLGHHQDDQVETVLFRLIRGSGTKGLAGIPETRSCGAGSIWRPMLGFRRSQLLQYALQEKLEWIEDGSNRDERYDRNFLRASIIPQLELRFPGVVNNIARTAVLCKESDELSGELAAIDLANCVGSVRNRLNISSMQNLSEARQRNLLRFWIASLQTDLDGSAPGHTDLHKIIREVLPAGDDREPSLFWGRGLQRVGIRRFMNHLYLLKELPPVPDELTWRTALPLELPFPLGQLRLLRTSTSQVIPEQLQQL